MQCPVLTYPILLSAHTAPMRCPVLIQHLALPGATLAEGDPTSSLWAGAGTRYATGLRAYYVMTSTDQLAAYSTTTETRLRERMVLCEAR